LILFLHFVELPAK